MRYEEEIEVSDNWSRFIVLKSSENGVPLTKISPFVIDKCIKSCAGEVKSFGVLYVASVCGLSIVDSSLGIL